MFAAVRTLVTRARTGGRHPAHLWVLRARHRLKAWALVARTNPPGAMPDGRKILVIAYSFPPDLNVGAVRPAKFAKYLSRTGWQPYVLTVKKPYLPATDWSRLLEVDHLPTIRTRCWPTLPQLALTIKRRLQRPAANAAGSPQGISSSISRNAERRGLLFHFKRYLNSVFELPDQQVGWLIPAVWAASRMIKTHGIRIVLVSSPPKTTALIGLLLSYLAPIRLVTDLRDPWFTPYLEQGSFFRSLNDIAANRSAIGDAVEHWLEKKIIARSVRVITTTEHLAVLLRHAYPSLADGRILAITNGYDAEELATIDPPEPGRRFTLSYLGSFYFDRTPRPFLEALDQFMRESKLSASDVEVNMIGDVRSTIDGSIEELIAACGVSACVRVAEPVSYKESLRQMFRSHVLLLFTPKQGCAIPAKTFEYLATHKPILCMAEDGATADLITRTGAGIVIPPEDVAGIKAALMKLFEAFREGQSLTNCADVSRYERKALSEQLSRHLVELL
jgi:glycosyltransferase involved in cell wall biosynthesis